MLVNPVEPQELVSIVQKGNGYQVNFSKKNDNGVRVLMTTTVQVVKKLHKVFQVWNIVQTPGHSYKVPDNIDADFFLNRG